MVDHPHLPDWQERLDSKQRDSWRVFRIISELVDGFETMLDLGPSVSFFGTARTHADTPVYNLSRELAKKLVDKGFAIITGGGPGTMEGASLGAKEAGGVACGLGIELPYEPANPYLSPKYSLSFRYFFIRKVMFVRYAQGFVVLPGGLGTLDELFEAMTLIQTEKIQRFPIYLVDTAYWKGLIDWLHDTALKNQFISEKDLDLIRLTDDLDEVVDGIWEHYQKRRLIENF